MSRVVALLVGGLLVVAGCGSTAAPTTPAAPSQSPANATGSATGQAAAQKPLTPVGFRLDYVIEGEHAPYFAALKQGYYSAAGLNVTIDTSGGSVTTIDAVANGSSNIGIADATAVVQAITKGVPVKMVADIFQKSPMAIAYDNKQNPMPTPQAICGKTIGQHPGAASTALFPAFLAKNNVSPSCFKTVNTDTSALPTLLLKHQIDGYLTFPMESLPPLKANGLDAGALQWADYGFNVLGTGIITSNTYLQAHPDVVRGFIAATAKGWDYAQQHPDEAASILRSYHPNDTPPATVATLQLAFPLLHTTRSAGHPFGWMAPEDWQETIATLQKYAGVTSPKPVDDYYSDAYVGGSSG